MIRRARRDDAGALAGIRHRAWHAAYAEILDPSDLPERPEPELWEQRLEDPDITTLVWDQDGRVAGFAAAGHGNLYGLYVDPPAQGAGVGSALHDAALGLLREQGFTEATLWTFVDNERARGFYEARGWAAVPGSEEPHEHVGVLEMRYRRPL